MKACRGLSPHRSIATGPSALSKQPSASVEQVVQELMNRSIPKSERMRLLRELVRSGEDVPDELLEKALRRLMERLTD